MLEKEMDKVKSRHKSQPINQDQFDTWYQDPITQRLFEELELSVIDSFCDYMTSHSVEEIALSTMQRQGAAEMVETVIDWSPRGVRNPNDEREVTDEN